jgi:hypothetical protein
MRTGIAIASALFLFLLCGSQAKADICGSNPSNLVVNCGFESSTEFAGWTLSGNDVPGEQDNLYGVESGIDPVLGIGPNSGSNQVFIGDLVENSLTLSQTMFTNVGEQYVVSFFLAQGQGNGPGAENNVFTATFGGATVENLVNVGEQGYTFYSGIVTATGPTSVLNLTGANEVGFFLPDDTSVTPMPEPSSFALMMLGMGLIGYMSLRKSRLCR